MSSASHAVGRRFKPRQGRVFIYKNKDEFELRISNYLNALFYKVNYYVIGSTIIINFNSPSNVLFIVYGEIRLLR